jgi:DNA-binding IclR family transcriptional regulator
MDIHDPGFRTLLVENTVDLLSDLRDHTGFTAAIAVFAKDYQRGLVLASLPGTSDHGYLPRVGFRFHLHATAPGKALLAFLPAATRLKIIRNLDLKRFTENTLCSEEALKEHLNDCANKRLVFDKGEYVSGINCVASCISIDKKQPLAAVWITSLMVDLPESDLPKFGKDLLKTVQAMEERLSSVIESHSLKHDYAMERAKQFIEEHFHDEEAVRNYHATIGMSSSWFRHLFREKYHVAPLSYRLQLLHERACRLLVNTNLSIKEIAFQLDYESQNYFSRAFKKKEGVSPAQYREKSRH